MTRLRWLVSLLAFGLLACSVEAGAAPSEFGYDAPAFAIDSCPPPDDLRDHEAVDPPRLVCPEAPAHRALAVEAARPAPLAGAASGYDIRAPPPLLQ